MNAGCATGWSLTRETSKPTFRRDGAAKNRRVNVNCHTAMLPHVRKPEDTELRTSMPHKCLEDFGLLITCLPDGKYVEDMFRLLTFHYVSQLHRRAIYPRATDGKLI
jgi:hypothetical protein